MSNDEYQQKQFFMNNESKHFSESEIKGSMIINGRKVIYLKEGVKRKRYNDNLNGDEIPHINQELINFESYDFFYKKIMGIDDFENT
jgi:hypothetical protein